MRVRTHLVAMPWASPDAPSLQLGSLKAYLERLEPRPDCRAYSAYFSILHELRGSGFKELFRSTAIWGEYLYQALYLRRFGPASARGRPAFLRLLKALRGPPEPPSAAMLDRLERATCRYLDSKLGPALLQRGLNVVGFTLSYDQVYASLYAAEHLRRRFPDRELLFLHGGSSPSFPPVYRLLCELRAPGWVVLGEGERKLERVVRALEALPPGGADRAGAALAGLDAGVVRIGEEVDLGAGAPAWHAGQIEDLSELPPPDYDEYYATLRGACADEQAFAAYQAETTIAVEGSRGCFGRCDFCAQNRSWDGFRKRSADEVLNTTLELCKKYRTVNVQFVDNVCDTWAEAYARKVVEAGLHQRSLLELRAHHPEEFWTLLALAGVEFVQIGVEALSTPLLRSMGKGSTAVQNLAAHKILGELGILSSNNLMTHHPASTLADVAETRRVLREIPHWSPFELTRFRLQAGSPLHERLTPEQRAALKTTGSSFRLPREVARTLCEFTHRLPPALDPGSRVLRAWSAFKREYQKVMALPEDRRPRMEVIRVAPDTLHITDTRDGDLRCLELQGNAARVYDACHRGLRVEQIVQAAGLGAAAVEAEIRRLRRERLVLKVDESWLALALRPRDELLRRFAAAGAAARPAVAPPAPAGRLAVVP